FSLPDALPISAGVRILASFFGGPFQSVSFDVRPDRVDCTSPIFDVIPEMNPAIRSRPAEAKVPARLPRAVFAFPGRPRTLSTASEILPLIAVTMDRPAVDTVDDRDEPSVARATTARPGRPRSHSTALPTDSPTHRPIACAFSEMKEAALPTASRAVCQAPEKSPDSSWVRMRTAGTTMLVT